MGNAEQESVSNGFLAVAGYDLVCNCASFDGQAGGLDVLRERPYLDNVSCGQSV